MVEPRQSSTHVDSPRWLGRHLLVQSFHELGHILLHLSKQEVILESDEVEAENQAHEREADQFAADTLIPLEAYKNFVESGSFYRGDIQRFAKQLGLDAGIVVGRLQHDGYIKNSWHNQLRSRYEWKRRK